MIEKCVASGKIVHTLNFLRIFEFQIDLIKGIYVVCIYQNVSISLFKVKQGNSLSHFHLRFKLI